MRGGWQALDAQSSWFARPARRPCTRRLASTGSRFIHHDTHTTRCAGRDLRGGWLAG